MAHMWRGDLPAAPPPKEISVSQVFMKQPPPPVKDWHITEQPVVIWMSGRFHRAAIVRVGPDLDRHVYIARRRDDGGLSPVAIHAGAKIIVTAGSDAGMRLAKSVGYPVAFTDDEFEFLRGVI